MIVTLEKVTTRAQAGELRKLRNECRHHMTGDTTAITRDRQREFYRTRIVPGKVRVLLLRQDGRAVAYGLLRAGDDGRVWMSCGVTAAARGRGLGTLIVRQVTGWGHDLNPGQPVLLEVWQDNWVARYVYIKAGYTAAGERVRDGRVIETWEHRQ